MANDLYGEALNRLRSHLHTLADKPEESAETTLNALWFAACGTPLSAVKAAGRLRPALHADQQIELRRLIDARLAGAPLAHLTGRQHFMGLELLAGPEAMIPRKETELLAETAIDILNSGLSENPEPRIIDLCTGAGNLATVLALAFPGARVFASDLSPECIELTKKNLALHRIANRVETLTGDLLRPFSDEDFEGAIDLIVCNPPYISTSKVSGMEEEIAAHEPSLAFDGGPFGISIVNRLVQDATSFLRPGGWLVFEIGLGQGPTVIKRIEKKRLYAKILPVRDREGNVRVISLQR